MKGIVTGREERSTRQPVVRYSLYCLCILLLVGYCVTLVVRADENVSSLSEVAKEVRRGGDVSSSVGKEVHVSLFHLSSSENRSTLHLFGEEPVSCDEHRSAVSRLVSSSLFPKGGEGSVSSPSYHMLPHPTRKSFRMRAVLIDVGHDMIVVVHTDA